MSEPARHQFQFVPAPAGLAPYLNSLYTLRIEQGVLSEMLPAYSGQLLLTVRGTGRLDFGSGFVEAPPKGFVIGPLTSARRFAIDGPALVLGASFNFHGWAALTRLPAASYGDRFIDLAEALGDNASGKLLALAERCDPQGVDLDEPLDALAKILQSRLQPLPEGHARLIEETYDWLGSGFNPKSADLYARLALSERQIQRLVNRFFGLSPSHLKRRYRAIRAATLLASPDLDWERRQQVLDAFYDQAHMIREIREFTGRTPRILTVDGRGLTAETLGKGGYGVPGLFAEDEGRQLKGSKGNPPD